MGSHSIEACFHRIDVREAWASANIFYRSGSGMFDYTIRIG